MIKRLENLSCWERLKELGLFTLENKRHERPHHGIPVPIERIQRGQSLSFH